MERQVADTQSKAEAAAEKQERLRVAPSVVVALPKGEKKAAVDGINDAISKGMQEAENRQQPIPKDLSYNIQPFGFRGTGSWAANGRNSSSTSNSSSSSTAKPYQEREKILLTFTSPEAADFLMHYKRKLPDGIYAEPLLTTKETKVKQGRMEEFKAIKRTGKQVTWHRARMMEYVKGDWRSNGRWREVGMHTKPEGRDVRVPPSGKVWEPVVRKEGK